MVPIRSFLDTQGIPDPQSPEAAQYLMGITDNSNSPRSPHAFPIPWATIFVSIDPDFTAEFEYDKSGSYLLDPTASVHDAPGGKFEDHDPYQLLTGAFQKLVVQQVPGGLAATVGTERVTLFPRLSHGANETRSADSGRLFSKIGSEGRAPVLPHGTHFLLGHPCRN